AALVPPGDAVPGPVTFTPGAGYTALASATISDPTTGVRLDLVPEYRIVSATGSFVADGTFGETRSWADALVAYRGLDTAPSGLPPGLNDVTAQVSVTPRKATPLPNSHTRLRLTLRNTSGTTFTGPLSLG